MKPILTIAFPTFNREKSLPYSIKSIISNIGFDLVDDIELLIIDNHSTDNSWGIIKDIKETYNYLNINCFQNDSNVGYDLNHYEAYIKATGDFIWFCSDRYIYDINLRTILTCLRESNVNILSFSSILRRNTLKDSFSPEDMYEIDLYKKLDGEIVVYNCTPCFCSTISNILRNNINKIGYPNFAVNVSDSVVRINRGEKWLNRLILYNSTYMLVIAALLRPFSELNMKIIIICLPYFVEPFKRIEYKGGRHSNLDVARGNLMLVDDFAFLGKKEEIVIFQISVLSSVRIGQITNKYRFEHILTINEIKTFMNNNGYTPNLILKFWIIVMSIPYYPLFIYPVLKLMLKVIFKILIK